MQKLILFLCCVFMMGCSQQSSTLSSDYGELEIHIFNSMTLGGLYSIQEYHNHPNTTNAQAIYNQLTLCTSYLLSSTTSSNDDNSCGTLQHGEEAHFHIPIINVGDYFLGGVGGVQIIGGKKTIITFDSDCCHTVEIQ